jgi:hypothetical protein
MESTFFLAPSLFAHEINFLPKGRLFIRKTIQNPLAWPEEISL